MKEKTCAPVVQFFQNDYTGNNAGTRYTFQFAPQTSAFFVYSFANRDFDGSTPDYKVNQAVLGFDHAFSPNTSLLLSGGYYVQNNDLFGDIDGYPYDVRLTTRSQYVTFSIGGRGGWSENFLDAQRFGFTRYTTADARLDYQAAERLNFYAGGYWRLDRDNLNFEWTTNSGNVGLTWSFLQYFSLSLDYRYVARRSDIPADEYTGNRVMLRLNVGKLYRW